MRVFAIIIILSGLITGVADAIETETEPSLTNDSAKVIAADEKLYDLSSYPSAPLPESTSIKSYTLTPHRYTQEGSFYHPVPPKTEEAVQVDEQNKVVKVVGKHELRVFKNWAEEKFFDTKFELLDKRFDAIEKKQSELDQRLAVLEKK